MRCQLCNSAIKMITTDKGSLIAIDAYPLKLWKRTTGEGSANHPTFYLVDAFRGHNQTCRAPNDGRKRAFSVKKEKP